MKGDLPAYSKGVEAAKADIEAGQLQYRWHGHSGHWGHWIVTELERRFGVGVNGLNYMQFPFRVVLAFLSFTWLAQLLAPTNAAIQFREAVWVSAVALEGIRLGLAIMIHLRGPGQQHRVCQQ